MTTFDDVLPWTVNVLRHHAEAVARLGPILVNRDLYGRIRLLVDERWEDDERARADLATIARALEEVLGPHARPLPRRIRTRPARGRAAGRGDAGAVTTVIAWATAASAATGPATCGGARGVGQGVDSVPGR